jgi:hypothetical protein
MKGMKGKNRAGKRVPRPNHTMSVFRSYKYSVHAAQ